MRDGLAVVAEAGLAYDVVVSPWQLPLVDRDGRRPAERAVRPRPRGQAAARGGDLGAWQADLARLAALPNVAVKLSGLVTEADRATWTPADLRPVIDHVLACFGADRTMAGSDWPVCLLAADYGAVQATLDPGLGALDPAGRADVLGGTAARWYRLGA